MMMAFDSSGRPPRGELDPATVETMREAIAHAVSTPTHPEGAPGEPQGDGAPALQDALRRVAREARERAIPPERLLVVLKGMWQTASVAQREAERGEHERRLREFVTRCIEEYFRRD